MPDSEDERQDELQKNEGEPPSGFDELLFAFSDALRGKRSKEAIATLIEQYAQEIPVAAKRRHRAMLWSYTFTVVFVAAVGVLGYLKIITNETAGTLLGAIVGALFYGRRSK